MAVDNQLGLLNQLWKAKFIILTAVALIALAALGYHFYQLSNVKTAELSQKSSELDAMNAKYDNLSGEHEALVASHENLSERYENITYLYNDLLSNTSTMRSDYANISASLDRFQEKGGAALALAYTVHRVNMPQGPLVFVNVTVYNVGNEKADRIVIKCKTIYQDQPSVDEHIMTDLDPLDKRTMSWNYSSYADIDAVWV